MANVPKALYRALSMPSVDTVLATVPASKIWIVTNVLVTNYSTAATATFNLEFAGAWVAREVSLAAKAIFTLDCAQVLSAAQVIEGFGTATSVSVHISGVETDV